jgi:hypothetical protein
MNITTSSKTLKGDAFIRLKYRQSAPFGGCDDTAYTTGFGAVGNITIGIGNNSITYNVSNDTTMGTWKTYAIRNISLTSVASLIGGNGGNVNTKIWALLRQNTSGSDCAGIGVIYTTCWDIESMTVEQYAE